MKLPTFNKIVLTVFLLVFIPMVIAFMVFYDRGYRLNLTESYPLGIYKVHRSTDLLIKKGDMILFCPPKDPNFIKAYQRGYLEAGLCPSGFWELQKKVMGIPGDRVVISDYVYINGVKIKNSKVYKVDPQLNDMNFMDPEHRDIIIPPGKMFVMSDYNDLSFDSRYFGLVDQNTTIGKTIPIYTLTRDQAKELKSY